MSAFKEVFDSEQADSAWYVQERFKDSIASDDLLSKSEKGGKAAKKKWMGRGQPGYAMGVWPLAFNEHIHGDQVCVRGETHVVVAAVVIFVILVITRGTVEQ